MSERFDFRWADAYRGPARLFGVTPDNAWVEVTDTELDARFGRWRVRTPLENIAEVEITGPYRMFKTAGPARLAVTDRGLTFATNGDRGLRVAFNRPVRGLVRSDLLRHPELTVTVADLDGLARRLR